MFLFGTGEKIGTQVKFASFRHQLESPAQFSWYHPVLFPSLGIESSHQVVWIVNQNISQNRSHTFHGHWLCYHTYLWDLLQCCVFIHLPFTDLYLFQSCCACLFAEQNRCLYSQFQSYCCNELWRCDNYSFLQLLISFCLLFYFPEQVICHENLLMV
jgi:hypothetical protein